MGIRSILDGINRIQSELVVPANTLDNQDDPIRINRVYKTVPHQAEHLEANCWINTYTLLPIVRTGFWETVFNIRMQLFIEESDIDRAADIANAFLDVTLTAFNTHIDIFGSVSHHNLSGRSPTLVGVERDGRTYVGLDLEITSFNKDIPLEQSED